MPPEFTLMPRFKSINFYQNKPKIKLFLQKNKIKFFECVAPRPKWSQAKLSDPRNSPYPPFQTYGYASDTRRVLLILPVFESFYENLLS